MFQVYDTTLRDGAQQEGINLSVADKLSSGLLQYSQDTGAKQVSVFTWRETWDAARNEGFDLQKPLSPNSVQKLAQQLGATYVFNGSYKVKQGKKPRVLLKWRITQTGKKPKELRVECR